MNKVFDLNAEDPFALGGVFPLYSDLSPAPKLHIVPRNFSAGKTAGCRSNSEQETSSNRPVHLGSQHAPYRTSEVPTCALPHLRDRLAAVLVLITHPSGRIPISCGGGLRHLLEGNTYLC